MTAYLGHQSVGENILDGIRGVCPSCSIRLLDLNSDNTLIPGLYHSKIGSNGDPYSKLEQFREIVTQIGNRVDIAMMKFCYVDITRQTEIQPLLDRYKSVMSQLAGNFPKLRIIHFTAPIRTLRFGIRSRVRLLLRQEIASCEDNLQRDAFNRLLRKAYGEGSQLVRFGQV
jgi:hypothetical protein